MLDVVAEAVGLGFEDGERLDVGLFLRGVGASGGKGDGDVVAGVPGGLFDGGGAGEDDQVGEGDLLAAAVLRGVEVGLDLFQRLEDLQELGGDDLRRGEARQTERPEAN